MNAIDDKSIRTLIAAADAHVGSKQAKLAKLKNILLGTVAMAASG